MASYYQPISQSSLQASALRPVRGGPCPAMSLTLEGSTVVLEKTPESPSDSKINQSILKELNPEYSLEGLMLKLKLQSFGHLMQRADSLEKKP